MGLLPPPTSTNQMRLLIAFFIDSPSMFQIKMAAFAKLANTLVKGGVALAVGSAVVNSALYNGEDTHKHDIDYK